MRTPSRVTRRGARWMTATTVAVRARLCAAMRSRPVGSREAGFLSELGGSRSESVPCRNRAMTWLLLGVAAMVAVGTMTGCAQAGHPAGADASASVSGPTASQSTTVSESASAQASPTVGATATTTGSLSAEELALREAALSMPEPQRPEGMDEFTPQGAAATAEYFLSLYPYVYATGDLGAWQAMSDPDCNFCNTVAEKVTARHAAGGWSDPRQQEVTATHYAVSVNDEEVWIVTLHISHPEGTDHDGSGGTSTARAEDITFGLQLRWTGQDWIIEEGAVQ